MNETTSTIEWRTPNQLKPHQLNHTLYGDGIDEEFLESCRAGIETPIIITPDNRIVSGHRRHLAARKLGMKRVRVVVRHDLVDELDIERALIESNRQREKTNEQKAREYKRLKEIEAERARRRQESTRAKPGEKVGAQGCGKMPQPTKPEENARSSEKAAESVGMSRHTAEKASEVVDRIDEAEESGDTETADELREELNTNVSGAHRKATADRLDETDEEIPLEHQVVEWGKQFTALSKKFSALFDEAGELAQSEGGAHLAGNRLEELRGKVENCKNVLKTCRPHAVCPYCEGQKCKACQQSGYVIKSVYDSAPQKR